MAKYPATITTDHPAVYASLEGETYAIHFPYSAEGGTRAAGHRLMDSPDFTLPIRDWLPCEVYVGHRPGLPDVILGRFPPAMEAATGRLWKTWICETPRELSAVQKRLAAPIPRGPRGELDFRAGPDGVLRRGRGIAPIGEIVVALYPAPREDWPLLILVSTPPGADWMERGIYSWEAMPTEEEAMAHLERIAERAAGAPVVILPPEPLS